MNEKIDNSLILNKIKSHYGIKSDAIFASFLGIKPNTLSNWRNRNTIDYTLLITKCEDIDANWLLTGKGEMLKGKGESMYIDALMRQIEFLTDSSKPIKSHEAGNIDKDYIIETQKKLIDMLEHQLRDAKKQIASTTDVRNAG